ncbi:MAG: hypothetical protein WEB52_12350 [Dehalococcoidia bacterium]
MIIAPLAPQRVDPPDGRRRHRREEAEEADLTKNILAFALTLVVLAVVFAASHCPNDPDCGHPGGECGSDSGCVPGFGGIDDTPLRCDGGGGGGGGGGGPASTPTPVIDAGFRAFGGEFSYNDDCTQRIDPVTMIIRYDGTNAEEHFIHHGVTVKTGGLQHFRDFEACVEGEYSTATNDGQTNCGPLPFPCGAEARMHVRCNVVGSAPDTHGGTFASCTPHFDEAVTCRGIPKHAIPDQMGDRWPGLNPTSSGFSAGRDYFHWVMVQEGGHAFIASRWWGNVHLMSQCNGWWTGSDGYVNHIDGS